MFLNGCFSQPGFHEKGKFTQLSWSLHSPNGQNCFQLLGTPWTGMKFTKATFQQVTENVAFWQSAAPLRRERNQERPRTSRTSDDIHSRLKWWKFIKSMAPSPSQARCGMYMPFLRTLEHSEPQMRHIAICIYVTYISRDLCSIWWKYILIIYDYAIRLSCIVLWIIISLPQVLGGHASPTVWTAFFIAQLKCTGECLDRSPLYPFRNSYRSVLPNPGNAQGNHPSPLWFTQKGILLTQSPGRTLGAARLDRLRPMIPPRFSQLFFPQNPQSVRQKPPPPCHGGVAWRLLKGA